MCSPRRKPEKGEILSTGSFVEQEKGQQKSETVRMGPSRGYVVQKEGSRKLRHDGVTTCFENGANSTARRQEAENDSFAAYCS